VRARLGNATHVHLATHAQAFGSDARARESYIVLAPGPDAGRHDQDGRLTVGEILDEVPDMRAELVVLSACETGLGDVKQAEGTVGLQRAFLARGARALLVTLWNVNDTSTAILMGRFYTHWGIGYTQAEALRRAQADMVRYTRFRHPRYWAAFQLVGAQTGRRPRSTAAAVPGTPSLPAREPPGCGTKSCAIAGLPSATRRPARALRAGR
jgi:CHAT domain-containing protein